MGVLALPPMIGAFLGAICLILRQLRRRFGSLTAAQEDRIKSLTLDRLEELGEAILDLQAIEQLDGWLGPRG